MQLTSLLQQPTARMAAAAVVATMKVVAAAMARRSRSGQQAWKALWQQPKPNRACAMCVLLHGSHAAHQLAAAADGGNCSSSSSGGSSEGGGSSDGKEKQERPAGSESLVVTRQAHSGSQDKLTALGLHHGCHTANQLVCCSCSCLGWSMDGCVSCSYWRLHPDPGPKGPCVCIAQSTTAHELGQHM